MKFVSAATVLSSTLLRDHSVLIEQLLVAQCGGDFAAQAHVAPLARQGRLSACYLVTGGGSTSVAAVTGARFRNAFTGSTRNTPQAERGIVLKLRRAVRQIGRNSLGKSAAIAKALEGIISVPGSLSFGLVTHPLSGETYEFSLEDFVNGSAPIAVGAQARLRLFSEISSHLVRAHTFRLRGFGDELSMVSGTRFLASSWSEWSEEIVCRARFRDLALAGLLSPRVAERCEVRVREALRFRTSPCLYHGDILGNWSNVLVDVHGRVCSLLDWEFGGSGAALEQEIASVLYCFHRDGMPLAEREVYLQAILRGFNVSPAEYLDSLRGKVNAFVILHAAKAINRLFPQPDTPMLIGQERENRLRFARRARSLMEQLAFE